MSKKSKQWMLTRANAWEHHRVGKAFELDTIWTRCILKLLKYRETTKVRIPPSPPFLR